MTKIVCFSCRQPVKEMKLTYQTVLIECDESRIHACKELSPDTGRDTDEETRDLPLEFKKRNHLRVLKAA